MHKYVWIISVMSFVVCHGIFFLCRISILIILDVASWAPTMACCPLSVTGYPPLLLTFTPRFWEMWRGRTDEFVTWGRFDRCPRSGCGLKFAAGGRRFGLSLVGLMLLCTLVCSALSLFSWCSAGTCELYRSLLVWNFDICFSFTLSERSREAFSCYRSTFCLCSMICICWSGVGPDSANFFSLATYGSLSTCFKSLFIIYFGGSLSRFIIRSGGYASDEA